MAVQVRLTHTIRRSHAEVVLRSHIFPIVGARHRTDGRPSGGLLYHSHVPPSSHPAPTPPHAAYRAASAHSPTGRGALRILRASVTIVCTSPSAVCACSWGTPSICARWNAAASGHCRPSGCMSREKRLRCPNSYYRWPNATGTDRSNSGTSGAASRDDRTRAYPTLWHRYPACTGCDSPGRARSRPYRALLRRDAMHQRCTPTIGRQAGAG